MWLDFMKGKHSPQAQGMTGHISGAPEIITQGEVRYLRSVLPKSPRACSGSSCSRSRQSAGLVTSCRSPSRATATARCPAR